MEAALTAIRALHYAAAILLLGRFVFASVVATREPVPLRGPASRSLAAAVLTALAWLALEASSMSGLPFAEALREGMPRVVLERTLYGHTMLVRAALAVALAVALIGVDARDASVRTVARMAGLACAALFLASAACMGHAAGGLGIERVAHVCADGLHLLAAGGWLGALVPLVALLRAISRDPSARLADAWRATGRFSMLGMACVGTLLLTGIVNAAYTMPRVSALFTSRYGLELLAKVALFSAIVAIATVNRQRLAPRLASGDAGQAARALRALGRNAVVEAVLGFAIVAIVGNLGITMPPMHG